MMRLWGCYWQPFHNSNHLCKLCKEYIHDEINLSKLNKVVFQIRFKNKWYWNFMHSDISFICIEYLGIIVRGIIIFVNWYNFIVLKNQMK